MAKIQLALDLSDIRKAVSIARKAAPYVDILEAGTPLIKAEGLRAIKVLKRGFPKKTIVADMKTMDTGAFETILAAEADADMTTVCGAADIETLRAAIVEGKNKGIDVAVDLLNVPFERWKKINSLNPGFIIIHVGIDQQKAGMEPLAPLLLLKTKSVKMVAGGINARNAAAAVAAGADIIIVGGAITKAKDPAKAAKEIKEAIKKI